MNKFEKQLEKWNNGVLRGAQAKLAKILGVSTATTALWTTGKRHPSKGYVAQMAELFHMDIFGVLKLFDNRSVIYPDPQTTATAHCLREASAYEYTYQAANKDEIKKSGTQSNNATLPFVDMSGRRYLQYTEADIIEWWVVPLRYARGAKYIVRSSDIGIEDAVDADDLCFVNPQADINDGKVLIFPTEKETLCTRRIQIKSGKQTLYRLNGKQDTRLTNKQPSPLGSVVRRIKGL